MPANHHCGSGTSANRLLAAIGYIETERDEESISGDRDLLAALHPQNASSSEIALRAAPSADTAIIGAAEPMT